jgi:hypothetical protein
LLRGFGPYGIIFRNVCAVITVAMIMLLRKAYYVYFFFLWHYNPDRALASSFEVS